MLSKTLKAIAGIDLVHMAQFVRFCSVGAVGFIVDAGTLLIAVHLFGVDPIGARLMSFFVAVLTTFELNRRWAFRDRGRRRWLKALTSYLGVQGLGFCCNFGLYTLLYLTLPQRYNAPLFCLAAASAVAIVINYLGASLVVFRPIARVEGHVGEPRG